MRATCGGVCGQCAALRQGGSGGIGAKRVGRFFLCGVFRYLSAYFCFFSRKKQKPRLEAGD